MRDVTDEMVRVAEEVLFKDEHYSPDALRKALRAALAAMPGEDVSEEAFEEMGEAFNAGISRREGVTTAWESAEKDFRSKYIVIRRPA